MLLSPIFKSDMKTITKEDLRYFMYLSRKDAWVRVGDDLFKFKIIDAIETTNILKDNTTDSAQETLVACSTDDQMLKLLFSKSARGTGVDSVLSADGTIEASIENKPLPDMTFFPIQKDFIELRIFMEGERDIKLHAKAYNFDYQFTQELYNITEVSRSMQFFLDYKKHREEAFKSALKNAFWLAVASGDNQQLQILFTNFPSFDINGSYNKQNILEVMFNPNPEIDLPFKGQSPDYKATFKLLVQHGLEQKLMFNSYEYYQSAQNKVSLFQIKNPHHALLLSIMKEIILSSIQNDENENDSEWDYAQSLACRII